MKQAFVQGFLFGIKCLGVASSIVLALAILTAVVSLWDAVKDTWRARYDEIHK